MFSFSFSVSEVTLRDLKNNSLYLKKFEKLRKKIEKTRLMCQSPGLSTRYYRA